MKSFNTLLSKLLAIWIHNSDSLNLFKWCLIVLYDWLGKDTLLLLSWLFSVLQLMIHVQSNLALVFQMPVTVTNRNSSLNNSQSDKLTNLWNLTVFFGKLMVTKRKQGWFHSERVDKFLGTQELTSNFPYCLSYKF